jgi:hypothetical protein
MTVLQEEWMRRPERRARTVELRENPEQFIQLETGKSYKPIRGDNADSDQCRASVNIEKVLQRKQTDIWVVTFVWLASERDQPDKQNKPVPSC